LKIKTKQNFASTVIESLRNLKYFIPHTHTCGIEFWNFNFEKANLESKNVSFLRIFKNLTLKAKGCSAILAITSGQLPVSGGIQ